MPLACISSQTKGDEMPRQIPHQERFPDYGVSHKDIRYGSYIEKIFYYAVFAKKPFTYEDHMSLRTKDIRKDTWKDCAKRLVSLGFLSAKDNVYMITPLGLYSIRMLGKRNASRRERVDSRRQGKANA
jgi:hypothetical protein